MLCYVEHVGSSLKYQLQTSRSALSVLTVLREGFEDEPLTDSASNIPAHRLHNLRANALQIKM